MMHPDMFPKPIMRIDVKSDKVKHDVKPDDVKPGDRAVIVELDVCA